MRTLKLLNLSGHIGPSESDKVVRTCESSKIGKVLSSASQRQLLYRKISLKDVLSKSQSEGVSVFTNVDLLSAMAPTW